MDSIIVVAIPSIIIITLLFSVKERKNTFENFIIGAKNGMCTVIEIFPTLIGLFVAVTMLRASGILNMLINLCYPIFTLVGIPAEILPVAILRPISGSSALAIGTDIMKQYGIDSNIGLIISTMLGSTETTIYAISIYTRGKNYKNSWKVLCIALFGDFIAVLLSVYLCRILS